MFMGTYYVYMMHYNIGYIMCI